MERIYGSRGSQPGPQYYISSILLLLNAPSLLLRSRASYQQHWTPDKQTQLSKRVQISLLRFCSNLLPIQNQSHSHSLFPYFSCAFYCQQPICLFHLMDSSSPQIYFVQRLVYNLTPPTINLYPYLPTLFTSFLFQSIQCLTHVFTLLPCQTHIL